MTPNLPALSRQVEAQDRAERIRQHTGEAWRLLAEAWLQEDWKALGYDSFVSYGQHEFGMSERSIGRTMVWAKVQGALESAAGTELPELSQREAVAAETELPKVVATVRRAAARGSDPVDAAKRALDRVTKPRKTAGQSLGARAEKKPKTPPIPVDSTEVPVPITERQVLDWLSARTDQENRAIGPPFRLAWEREAKRLAEALGVVPRRQGTVSRPADRTPTNGTCSHPREKRRQLSYGTLCGECDQLVKR